MESSDFDKDLFKNKTANYNRLFNYMKEAIKNNNCELEFVYGSHPKNYPLNRNEFIRILKDVRQKYNSISESTTLDITGKNFENVRCTIYGIENIKKYCKTDSLDDISNISFMKKKVYKNQSGPSVDYWPIIDYDYNFRINIKEEEELEITDEKVQILMIDWKNQLKAFRYKKRYSFITPDNLFRIDLTSLKSTNHWENFKTFLESGILKNNETFELEIEYIGSNKMNDSFPIDQFRDKLYLITDKQNPYEGKYPELLKYDGDNNDSDFVHNDMIAPEDDLYKDIPPGINSGEFVDEILYNTDKKTVRPDWSFEDIKYEYWEESNQEWLFEAILTYDKKILYISETENYTASYNNAPKNTDYIQYSIFPEFTKKEIEEIEEIDDNFNNMIFVPSNHLVKISKFTKSVSWGPDKARKYSSNKSELKVNEGPEITMKDDKKWIPEEYVFDDPFPLVTFEQLKEAGEFDEDIKIQEKVQEHKIKNKKPENLNDVTLGLIDEFKKVIREIIKLKEDSNLVISQSKKHKIIKEYRSLTEQKDSSFINKKKNELTRLQNEIKKDKGNPIPEKKKNLTRLTNELNRLETETTRFIGPNPVSMSLNDINIKNKHSILEGYVVTEKADGIRAQLFIGSDRYGYLITQKMEIIGTNIIFKGVPGTWLFDGEYITKNINNEDIELFMIFDVYYCADGQSKYPSHAFTYPWLTHKIDDISRYNIIQDFQKMADIDTSESSMRIGFKNYLEGPKKLQKSKKNPEKYSNISGIFKQSNKILDLSKKRGYEYNIDGLIYMPMFMPVRAMEEGSPNNFIGGEWSINYKWKPPEENTIDFRVRFVKEEINKVLRDKIISTRVRGKSVICKQVQLYVGYSIKKDIDYDFTLDILQGNDVNSLKEILFNPEKDNKSLYTCNIPLKNGKLICEKDGSEILNESFVEMRYNPDSKEMNWIPLRVRSDKTRPQFFIAANNIWNTIIDPVTENMITGQENLEEIEFKKQLEEHSYYVGSDEETKIDEPLRKLHNYIKSKLIASICSIGSRSISIMDTSIGRGGDIKKYLFSKNPIDFIFALDISPDIRKATYIYQMEVSKKPRALFMQYDTSESIENGAGFKGNDEIIDRNRHLIDIIYDKKKNIPKKYEGIEKKYRGFAKRKFNIISSQFSVHYYFKNEITLRGYIKNLSDNCEKGGYFIGTCYDGMKVFNLLKQDGKVEMFDEFKNKVYSIEKNYDIDDFTYNKDNIEQLFGQVINVYMSSIGMEIPEYLVNFDMFKNIMEEYRFRPVKPQLKGINRGIFDNEKYLTGDGMGSFEEIIDNLDKLSEKDPLIKKSRQNSLIKGPYYKALEINNKENEKLKLLSSLNNWFIFQKY
ncbi:MAG: hypothetical protein CMK44_01465 [Porticoccus sp.]|nr:hypothetical protein [Porticoccus sp.]